MKLGINTAIASQQRIQQKQQSFEAFKYTQPIEELMPLIKRAQIIGMELFTPEDIVTSLQKKDSILAGMVFTPETKKLFKQITSGHLFNASEKARMIEEADCGFGNVRLEAEEIMETAAPLPVTDLTRGVAAIEVATRTNVQAGVEINELELRLREARSLQDKAVDALNNENARLRKLGFE